MKSTNSRLSTAYWLTFLIIALILVFIFDLSFYRDGKWTLEATNTLFFIIFVIASAIALIIYLRSLKIVDNFIMNEQGIQTGEILYPWKMIRHYHWLGEAQEERVGIIGISRLFRYDPINLYNILGIHVARLRLEKPWYRRCYLNLKIDPSWIKEFEMLCKRHRITQLSPLRMYLFGINPYPLIVFFVLPLTVLIIVIFFSNK